MINHAKLFSHLTGHSEPTEFINFIFYYKGEVYHMVDSNSTNFCEECIFHKKSDCHNFPCDLNSDSKIPYPIVKHHDRILAKFIFKFSRLTHFPLPANYLDVDKILSLRISKER